MDTFEPGVLEYFYEFQDETGRWYEPVDPSYDDTNPPSWAVGPPRRRTRPARPGSTTLVVPAVESKLPAPVRNPRITYSHGMLYIIGKLFDDPTLDNTQRRVIFHNAFVPELAAMGIPSHPIIEEGPLIAQEARRRATRTRPISEAWQRVLDRPTTTAETTIRTDLDDHLEDVKEAIDDRLEEYGAATWFR